MPQRRVARTKPRDRPQPGQALDPTKRAIFFGALLLVALIALIFSQTAGFPFIENWDDGIYVTKNPHVLGGVSLQGLKWAFEPGYAANWHPLTWVSHMLDVHFFGTDASGHHLMSVLLHALNSVLLFVIFSGLTKSVWRSLVVATLFAVHPLHVESVAWIAERKDVLSTFFLMLTVWSYGRFASTAAGGGGGRRISYVMALLFLALGLASKPMLVSAPLLLLLLDFWPLKRLESVGAWRLIVEKIPFFGLSAVSSALTIFAQQSGGAIVETQRLPFDARVSNALLSYVAYLFKAVWPVDLSVFYPFPHEISLATVTAAAGVVVAISIAAFVVRKKAPYVVVGWLWFLVSLVPVIGIVQVGSQGLADRYTYIPLIGVFLAVVWGVGDLVIRLKLPKVAVWAAVAFVVSVLAVDAHAQASYWSDELTLWQHAVDVSPGDSYTANGQVGSVLARRGRSDEALAHFVAAVRSNPGFPDGHVALGTELATRGRLDEALVEFREAARLRPDFPRAEGGVASVLLTEGKTQEAVTILLSTLGRHADFVEGHIAAASALASLGRYDESISHWSQAIQLRPDVSALRDNRGNVLASRGRVPEAIEDFQEAVRLDPRSEAAHLSLAQAFAVTGRNQQAISEYRAVLNLNPQNTIARQALAKLGGG